VKREPIALLLESTVSMPSVISASVRNAQTRNSVCPVQLSQTKPKKTLKPSFCASRFCSFALREVIRKSLDPNLGPPLVAGVLLLIALVPFSPEAYSKAQLARSKLQASPASTAKPAQEAKAPASVTPQTAQPIPLPQIANRAEELDLLLRDISSQITMRAEFLDTERNGASQAEEIRQRTRQAWNLLAGTPTPMEMEDELRYWRSRNEEYASHRKLLTERAAEAEEQRQVLEAQQAEWQATWDQIRDSPSIEAVADRILQQLNKIRATREQVLQQLNMVLTLQNQVSQQDQQISDVLIRVRQARERERGRLLQLDSLPLWKIRELREQDRGARPVFQRPFYRSFQTGESFLAAGKLVIFWFAIAYVLTLIGLFNLKDHVTRTARAQISPEALQLLNRPFSVAVLVSLLVTVEFAASSPVAISISFYLLYLIPVLRLLAPRTQPWLRTFLYILATFAAIEGLYSLVQLPPLMRREILILIVLAALASIGWLAYSSRGQILAMQGRSRRILLIALRGSLVLLLASLVCSVIGAVSLSQALGLVTLVGPFMAVALYCGAHTLTQVLSTVLHTPWAEDLLEARAHSVERWGERILAVVASLLWLRVMLRFFAAYGTVISIASGLLRIPIGLERFHFTLGDTLGLLFILLGGYAVANAVTFFLKKVVLPKLTLRRGVPYAISTVTYYFLLLMVALSALFAAGVDLNKFTVLTGALGVGLGFGLQNIVNNFVSGLILIFERPISIGDTVDVGGLVGVVRRIGARASTVVTYQGAEVIVPNSTLISNQVINWTLSSPWRRVDVRLSVAHGTDPERVIRMLVGVAESHPGVLLARPPAAFFMGFGESALNFELRFWCAEQDTWLQLQSDISVAIVKALKEAGIEIPFPQRDLHVRSVDVPVADTLASNKARSASSDLPVRSARR